MHDPKLLFDVLFLLLAAVVIVPLFQALRIPAVLGYLVGGALLGPHTPGPVVDMELPQVLSEFGVVFLLFAIGLELPLSRLQAMRRYIFGLGLMQVALTSAAIAAVAYALGENMAAALVIGGMLAFSSTATVLKLLVERGETVARFGRVSVAVLIFQDLAVVPLLTLLPLLAGGTPAFPGRSPWPEPRPSRRSAASCCWAASWCARSIISWPRPRVRRSSPRPTCWSSWRSPG